ncbi:MAG: methionyl-tRNA formyltransferase, partial [Vampirovibrionia bacterium]
KGDKVSGVTTMLTDDGVDCGDILIMHEIEVDINEDTVGLTEKMSVEGAGVMLKTLIGLKNGTIKPVPQNHNLATKAPKLKKSLGNIKWEKSTFDIHNTVRGRKPWPGAFTYHNDLIIKLHKTLIPDDMVSCDQATPGCIKEITKNSIQVYTGDGFIDIVEVQPPNKSIMKAADWARGAHLKPGDCFVRQV